MCLLKKLKKTQLVIANGLYWRFSYDYYLDSMERLGIKNIELHGNVSHFPSECLSEFQLHVLNKKIKDRNLSLITVAHDTSYSYPNIAVENEAARKHTIEIYKKLIYQTAILGCRQLQLLPGHGAYDQPATESWNRSKDSLIQICEEARKYEITIILENSSPHNTNVANTTGQILQMIREVGAENLYGMLDFCSVAKAEDNFADAYQALGGKMKYIHLCDGNPMGHMAPGDGSLDVDGNLNYLDEQGYSGYLSYEIYNDLYDRNPEMYIRRGLDYMYRKMAN